MKKYGNALIFSLAIVAFAFFLSRAYLNRNSQEGKIQVTGLGQKTFSSDLVIWTGSFSVSHKHLKMAYRDLERNKDIVLKYFKSMGVIDTEVSIEPVRILKRQYNNYTKDGRYIGSFFQAYDLEQVFRIETQDIDKVETIASGITKLIDSGIEIRSNPSQYYYTKLADLKIEMISKATKDAKKRADKIAKFSDVQLGKLRFAKMGVFQITGLHSNEDYSWGGAFNTSSRLKKASITMKLVYQVD